MKKENIVSVTLATRKRGKTDWAKVRALTDAQIVAAVKGDPDTMLLDDDFWENAVWVNPPAKVPTSLRIDPDVLAFFKSEGRGYQTRMNAVLRTYMNHRVKSGAGKAKAAKSMRA